jgi:hypothetical protein
MRKTAALAALPLLALLALCLAPGCSSETGKPVAKGAAGGVARSVFPPIADCNLELELVSPQTEFFRGDVAPTITFRLKNSGLKPVTVREWMAKERDNIKILYARCDGYAKPESVPASEWKAYAPKLKDPVMRMPLDLFPRNATLVSVDLAFLKDALASKEPQGKASYALVGELNLSSVSAKTKPFVLTFK